MPCLVLPSAQIHVWDPRNLVKPIYEHELDTQSGVLMAFVDEDTGLVYVGGKGDGNIRVFDLWEHDPPLNMLTEFGSKTPQRGLCCLPKIACDTKKAQVTLLCKAACPVLLRTSV